MARKFLLGTFLAITVPVSAYAQTATIPEGVGVADRPRLDYQPIGGRLGSFFLYPVIDARVDATDNARATTADRLKDVTFDIAGRAKLRSNFSRHALNLQTYIDQSYHANVTTENATRYGGQVDGTYDISNNTKVSAVVLADHGIEARTSYNSPLGAISPGRFNRVYAGLVAQQKFGRLDVGATFAFTSNQYDNVKLSTGATFDQHYRNSHVYSGTLTAGYLVRPGISVIARGVVDKVAYTLPASDPLQPGNLNRDSTGVRVESGLRFELTSLLYGDVRVGYYKRNYSDSRLQGTSGLSYGADLLWNVTPLTSLRVAADRRVDEAASTTIGGNRTTDLQASVDHELLRNLLISANVRHLNIVPLGPLQASNELYVGAGARMWVSRQLSVRIGYRHAKRTSPVVGRAFRENLANGGVQLTF